jgi:hypothetical protein
MQVSPKEIGWASAWTGGEAFAVVLVALWAVVAGTAATGASGTCARSGGEAGWQARQVSFERPAWSDGDGLGPEVP